MSISIGIYDFFSYTVPGIVYLFVAYATLLLFRPVNLNLSKASDVVLWGGVILVVLASFLLGHIFDFISHRLWYRLFYRDSSPERAYEKFTKIKDVRASFDPHQWQVLLGVIRHNDLQLSDAIDRNKATSIMLRNISYALFLLGIVFAVRAAIPVNAPVYTWYVFAALAVVTFVASGLSLRRSDEFNMGFYHMIYTQVLMYGDSLEKIIEANRNAIGVANGSKARSPKRLNKSRKGE